MVDVARRHQAKQRPGRLRGSAGRLLVAAIVELVARTILAPAAIGVLNGHEPAGRLAEFRPLLIEARGTERAQHGPGAVDVVHAPTAEPASIGKLRGAQIIDGAGG